jgi:ADP-ribose pyrophosphatase YjhB (NUDIX family)
MRIAFLGWGSLVWDPRNLKVFGPWQEDGPILPVEFARVSDDGRLTLVLHPSVPNVPVLWVLACCEDIAEATKSLADREDTPEHNIGFVSIPDNKGRCKTDSNIQGTIKSWAKSKAIDVVVWTDLPKNFEDRTKMIFNEDNVVRYLKGLKGLVSYKAEEYVRRAPEQINTQIRKTLEEQLGWCWRPTSQIKILRRRRIWPVDWREQMLMDQVHGRTEIYMYKVKSRDAQPFWKQVPVSTDVVAVVAHDNKKMVYLVRQSRPAWDEKHKGVLVLPGGGVPAGLNDEELLHEAKRELREETGYECKRMRKLTTVLCSGRIRSKHHIFLAKVQRHGKPKLEKEEKELGLYVESLDLNTAIELLGDGSEEETTGYTLLGLLLAREMLARK